MRLVLALSGPPLVTMLMMLLFGFLLFLEFKFVEKSVYYEN